MGEHLAQACKHVGAGSRQGKEYHQWIFFDDVWASAHTELANGLLRFAARWDVLWVLPDASPAEPSRTPSLL